MGDSAARGAAAALILAAAATNAAVGGGPKRGPETPGIWVSPEELAELPTGGHAWNAVLAAADMEPEKPEIHLLTDSADVRVVAKAMVYARTGDERYRFEVVQMCMEAIGTEQGGNALGLARNLLGYIIAADLIGLPPAQDTVFREWLAFALTEDLEGRTLQTTHEERPNNWGTHAGASRAALARYLGDDAELQQTATIFKAWLGDRDLYAGFDYGELSWQADPKAPVGINPLGSTKDFMGRPVSIDGVLPDDQRRGGPFTWPPPQVNYVYEALQGAVAQALILDRAGYDEVWDWEDQALLRAFQWLHGEADFPAQGDDTWIPHVINYFYGTDFPAPIPSSPGKNVGWTDWTLSMQGQVPPIPFHGADNP